METPRTEYNKQYYLKNKAKLKAYASQYYADNKPHVLTKVKEHSTKETTKVKARGYKRKYKKENPHMERGRRLRVRYNITQTEYNDLFASQQGCCKICAIHQSSLKKRLAVDHCHTTGIVRGLLCDRCNLAIGHFKDDLALVLKAANYLKETQDGTIKIQ